MFDKLNFELRFSEKNNITIELIDITGKLIYNYNKNGVLDWLLQINLSDLSKGLYLSVIKTNKSIYYNKIIVE